MNDKIVLKNAHLVIDDKKEILNGTLLIKDGKIEEVFYDFDKIKKELHEYKILDLKGKIVMPAFFDSRLMTICGQKDLHERFKYGIVKYLSDEIYDEDCLGLHKEANIEVTSFTKAITLNPNRSHKNEVQAYRQRGIKILLGNCLEEVKELDFDYDGFARLFYDSLPFNLKDRGLINLALEERKKMIEIKVDQKMRFSFLNFLLKTYPKDQIIFIAEDLNPEYNLLNTCRMAYQEGISLMDLVAYTSMNAYRFYDLKRYGGLIKGKEANLLIVDEDFKNILIMQRGMIL